jgi:hypothetical protein
VYFTSDNELGGMKMQPTIHLQSEYGYFKYRIILKGNYESMKALVPMILFITTDIYEKVKNVF